MVKKYSCIFVKSPYTFVIGFIFKVLCRSEGAYFATEESHIFEGRDPSLRSG